MRPIIMTAMSIVAASTMTFSGTAMAAESKTDAIARDTGTPISTRTENPVFEYSARKILGFVSEARVSLHNEQKEIATTYIDESLRELNGIRNTRNYLEMMGVRFGRVFYGESASYYIPIADNTYAVRSYARGPFWSADKATAVRDVELVNVDIAINPERAMAHLQVAKQQIQLGEFDDADRELKAMLDESIHQTTLTGQPYSRLQDNIYLTRVLIRQENYDGARFTLKHAKAALDEYEKTVTTPQRSESVKVLREEIDAMDRTIEKRDPTLLKKAADRVDEWWKDVKAWTREKTAQVK